MLRWVSLLLVAAAVALASCAAKETAPVAPAAPAPEAKPAWQEEWERLLEAAKQEGKVVVSGPDGRQFRQPLTESFERKYGIKVEYLGISAAAFGPRLEAERKAGQYLWDVFVGPTRSAIISWKEMNALEPLEPALILSEVKDPKKWRGGSLPFVEKDKVLLAFGSYATGAFCINTNLVRAEEFRAYRDLLDPKWKGKLLLHDPSVPGASQAKFHFFYVHKDLGPDFIRALLKQEPTISRSEEVLVRWLAEGKAPIFVGCGTAIEPLIKQGVPVTIVNPRQMREGLSLHVGNGSVALFNKAPNPNAAKVYINWLLSREGQIEYARSADVPSRRLDVPTDIVTPWAVPAEGISYLELDGEDRVWERLRVVTPFLNEVFPR